MKPGALTTTGSNRKEQHNDLLKNVGECGMQPPIPKFGPQLPPLRATVSLDGEKQHPVLLHIDTEFGIFYGKLTDELRPPASNDPESEADQREPEAIPA